MTRHCRCPASAPLTQVFDPWWTLIALKCRRCGARWAVKEEV